MILLTRFKMVVDLVSPQRVGVMVASHNEDTVRFTLQQMQKNNIKPEDKVDNQRCLMNRWYLSQQVICFGQLLGMCDNLSFPLGETDLFERLYCEPSSVQVRQASACTSTFRMDQWTKCFHTCPGIRGFYNCFQFFFYCNRRAHENKGILEKLEKEKSLLKRELKDRVGSKTTNQLFVRVTEFWSESNCARNINE